MAASALMARPIALFHKWWGLPLSQKLIVNHILAIALAVEAAIRIVRLRRLASWLGLTLADTVIPEPSESTRPNFKPKELHQARLTVEVMEHWPFAEGTCLRQALIVGYFLRRQDPTLLMGVRKDGHGIATHAWIEVGGSTVGLDDSFLPFHGTR